VGGGEVKAHQGDAGTDPGQKGAFIGEVVAGAALGFIFCYHIDVSQFL